MRLKLVTTFILPVHGDESFGTAFYPVPKSFLKRYLKGVDWSARYVVAGAVVMPKEQVEVVAVVRMTTRKTGTAKAVTVNYSQNGITTRVTVPTRSTCSWAPEGRERQLPELTCS